MSHPGLVTKVLCIFGTRPEAIKMAPLIKELRSRPWVDCKVCVTAQHREMLDDVLDLFGITPDFDLDVMRASQSPSQVVAAVLTKLEGILREEQPDWLLVQGDTVTTMAAAMAGFFERIPVGHVEAGLRTFDKWHPYPEEMARSNTRILADLHFAPTVLARDNLLKEGISPDDVFVTGNTVIDALLQVADMPVTASDPRLDELIREDERLVLVTAHRRESFGGPLRDICQAITEIADSYPDVRLVYPVHPNPNVRELVGRTLDGIANVSLVAPLDYLSLVRVMKASTVILTDSGGIQEEAPSLRVPVLVLREVTERTEVLELGAAKLVGTDPDLIVKETSRLLDDPIERARMSPGTNPYGDGSASRQIVDALLRRRSDDRAVQL